MSQLEGQTVSIVGGVLDLRAGEIRRGAEVSRLTSMERRLLTFFIERSGALISAETLLVEVWGYRSTTRTRAISHAILRLRKKLEVDPANPTHIVTEFGEGYRWVPLPADHPEAPTPLPEPEERRRSFLIPERDAFIGRRAELAALAALLEEARLISILGAGGIGKTRLVQHFGTQALPAWPGGVWFCDLSDTVDLAGIVRVIGQALGVSVGGPDPVARLASILAARGRCLVILDNFEQVAHLAHGSLDRWLDRAHDAAFVVTTREVLGLAGEQVMHLDPLPPEDSAALFLARADSRHSAPDAHDPETIRALVDVLDHLPLAIELAASRTRVLSPAELLARMDDRFRLLASGRRRGRQATLRATLDWSWGLLTDWEQSALAQLSVFEQGFTLEAVEVVVELSAFGDAPWSVDVVQSLVDRSLVRRVEDGRFGMLVSIQAYAAEKLAELEQDEPARRRHGQHFAKLGTPEAVLSLRRHGSVARYRYLQREQHNIIAACRRAGARGDAEVGVRTLWAALEVLQPTGLFDVVADLGAPLLALTAAPEERVILLWVLGEYCRMKAKREESRQHYQEALALVRSNDLRALEGRILAGFGILCAEDGQPDEALRCYAEALEIFRREGVEETTGVTLGNRGLLLLEQGRVAEAQESLVAALERHRAVGNTRSEGIVLGQLGLLQAKSGQHSAALKSYTTALERHRAVGNARSEGIVLSNLGGLQLSLGDIEAGTRTLLDAAALSRSLADDRFEGFAMGNLSTAHRLRGEHAAARQCALEAIRLHRAARFLVAIPAWRSFQALAVLAAGDAEEALAIASGAVAECRAGSEVEGYALAGLARVHLARGEAAAARQAIERAAPTQGGDVAAMIAAVSALTAAAQGRHRDAQRACAEARVLAPCAPGSDTGRMLAEAEARIEADRRMRVVKTLI